MTRKRERERGGRGQKPKLSIIVSLSDIFCLRYRYYTMLSESGLIAKGARRQSPKMPAIIYLLTKVLAIGVGLVVMYLSWHTDNEPLMKCSAKSLISSVVIGLDRREHFKHTTPTFLKSYERNCSDSAFIYLFIYLFRIIMAGEIWLIRIPPEIGRNWRNYNVLVNVACSNKWKLKGQYCQEISVYWEQLSTRIDFSKVTLYTEIVLTQSDLVHKVAWHARNRKHMSLLFLRTVLS